MKIIGRRLVVRFKMDNLKATHRNCEIRKLCVTFLVSAIVLLNFLFSTDLLAKAIETPYGPVEGLDFSQYGEDFAARSQLEYDGIEYGAGVLTDLVFSITEENMKKKKAETTVKDKFSHLCAPCHGETGKGDGQFFATVLTPKPANLTDSAYMATLADSHIFNVISGGSQAVGKSNLCPPWGMTFNKEWINDMVSFVRTLSAAETAGAAQIVSNNPNVGTQTAGSTRDALGTDEGGAHPVRWIVLGFATAFFIGVAVYEWGLVIKKK